jgi:hypothetical protein
VDVTGFFGPTGANILISAGEIGVYNNYGLASANLGFMDPVDGVFAMSWGAVTVFKVFDSTGTTNLGTGELLLVSPETGTYNPVTGMAVSQTAGPVPATMILHNNSGGSTQAIGITINNYNTINRKKSTATTVAAEFASNGVPALTIGLPAMLGGGTLLADIAGTVQFTLPNITLLQPQIAGGAVAIGFTVGNLSVSTFQLLKASQITGPWVQDTGAVLTTNVPGVSYSFSTTTAGAPIRFYKVRGM